MIIKEGLTFDDVLLEPQHSSIKSRATVDVSVRLGPFTYDHPIVPANMKTIIGIELAREIVLSNGLAILHRFMSMDEQIDIAKELIKSDKDGNNIAFSVGIKEIDKENVARFHDNGVKILCIDVAHADSSQCLEMTNWIKTKYPDLFLISGNVATGAAAKRLWKAGADVVKCGIGGGSICTTRITTANGVPQLSALIDIANARQELMVEKKLFEELNPENKPRSFPFISDGGHKTSADIVKALCFADAVMVGNMVAGCEESPGKSVIKDGVTYKEYVGSSTHKSNHIEGVQALVKCKGKYKDILQTLMEGLKSGCSYQGARNLLQLRDNPVFIRITNAGLIESRAHDVYDAK